MKVDNTKIQQAQLNSTQKSSQPVEKSEQKFSDELKNLDSTQKSSQVINKIENKTSVELKNINLVQKSNKNLTKITKKNKYETLEKKDDIKATNKKSQNTDKNDNEFKFAINNLNKIVVELNQSDEKKVNKVKNSELSTETNSMINNDYNIQDKDLLPQMNPNMNFSGNGQPFSSFMNNDSNNQKQTSSLLGNSIQDLAEEANVLSTMAENIAIANKNIMMQENKEVEVINETGIKKVDIKTGITTETIVKYDSIIMNQTDVEVFVELVQKGEIDLNEINTQSTEKSVQVSKTLSDMLAKAMEDNKPLRINFDNDISVIIRISRDGKIIADFLPSSQVAEAYLKENLPLLRQRFDNNNMEYESLNHRERREHNKENNRKKGQNNE